MWKALLVGIGIALGAAIATVWVANARFDRQVDRRIEVMFAARQARNRIVTEDDLTALPEPVQRWLRQAGILGKPVPSAVRLRQEGEIRLGPDQRWMPFTADQYYTIDPACFIWRVSATAVPGLFIRGVDAFQGGLGRMEMRPLALFPVVDASGPTLNQGAALRYLQEMVWFPFAALSENVSWEPIDESRATAILHAAGNTVEGVVHIDDDGRLTAFEADRYRDEAPEAVLRPWRAVTGEHHRVADVLIPTSGEGIWKLDDGPFTYIRVRIIDLDYDIAAVYPR